MRTDELVDVLAEVPGLQVSVGSGLPLRAGVPAGAAVVTAYVPAIGDAVRLAPADVLGADRIVAPTGAPAMQLGVRRGHEELPLIVTVDDVVFMPAYAADLVDTVDSGTPLRVPDAPDLVAYSEMHRDVRALGRTVQKGDHELDPDLLAATLLVHRCFLAGAVRVGLWPVRVAAWWEYTWAEVGADLALPPFRADPTWDQLMADVREARRHTAARAAS